MRRLLQLVFPRTSEDLRSTIRLGFVVARKVQAAIEWVTILVAVLLCFGTGPLLAQTASPPEARGLASVLVVVVPSGESFDSSRVERWVQWLKAERERQHLDPEVLGILRLSFDGPGSRALLESLNVKPSSEIQNLLCWRGPDGQPNAVAFRYPTSLPADRLLLRVVADRLAVTSPSTPEPKPVIGLIFFGPASESGSIDAVVLELGRVWLMSGRELEPAPFPMVRYGEVTPGLMAALGLKGVQDKETASSGVSLALFRDGKPIRSVRFYSDLKTPATLARKISRERAELLSAGIPVSSSENPKLEAAAPLGWTHDQERVLLVDRLAELARELWNQAAREDRPSNEGPRRLLLQIIEGCRRFDVEEDSQEKVFLILIESLKDYRVEPLSGGYPETSERFDRLVSKLLKFSTSGD